MISLLNTFKNDLKYKNYEISGDKVTVLGIGKKSIKYSLNDEEPKFAFYDSFEGKIITRALIKSFENDFWNENVRSAIADQEKYCRDHNDPLFAPADGFCHSCGKQIYTNGYEQRASNELITGCPHCHRSYCD